MRKLLGIAALAMVLAGCGGSDSSGSDAAQPPWYDGIQAAAAVAKVGETSSACELPVTLDVPDKWKPEGVEPGVHDQGGLDVRCEIDGKPASVIGFVRVYAGSVAREPRQVLETFVADGNQASDVQYRDTSVGAAQGIEATWRLEGRTQRAFATTTRSSTVVVAIGGLDEEEHRNLVPAYLLAKQSLAPRDA